MDLLRTDDGCVFNSDGVASSDDGEPPFRWPSLPRHMDIVKGNRYRMDAKVSVEYGLVPDDSGPWLALVTFRGEKATPRPEVLPVGTRVRRGEHWNPEHWGYDDEQGCGHVTDSRAKGLSIIVRWASGKSWYHPGDDLEAVSLPEPAKAEPWPADAVLVDTGASRPPRYFDAEWHHHEAGVRDTSANDYTREKLRAAKLVKGTRYSLHGPSLVIAHAGAGWLCVRDYVGPDCREPAPEVTSGQYARTLVAGPGAIGSSTGHEIRVGGASVATAKPSSAAFKVEWLDRAMAGVDQVTIGGVTYTMATAAGPKAAVTDDVRVKIGVPDKATHGDMVNLGRRLPGQIQSVCMLPDYLPPRIAKARGRTFVVPTDLDIDNFPDADEGMRGRIR